MEPICKPNGKNIIHQLSEITRDDFDRMKNRMKEVSAKAENNTYKRNDFSTMSTYQFTGIADFAFDDYIFIDMETDHLSPDEARIIDITMMRVKNHVPEKYFSTLLDPKRELSIHISDITGITNKDLEGKPTFGEIKSFILDFIRDTPIVGYHLSFELNNLYSNGLSEIFDGRAFVDLIEFFTEDCKRRTKLSSSNIFKLMRIENTKFRMKLDECLSQYFLFQYERYIYDLMQESNANEMEMFFSERLCDEQKKLKNFIAAQQEILQSTGGDTSDWDKALASIRPFFLSKGKNIVAELDQSGTMVINIDCGLSVTESTVFSYYCFLVKTYLEREFLKRKAIIIVFGLTDRLDASYDFKDINRFICDHNLPVVYI